MALRLMLLLALLAIRTGSTGDFLANPVRNTTARCEAEFRSLGCALATSCPICTGYQQHALRISGCTAAAVAELCRAYSTE